MGGARMDAFMVKIPSQLLTGSSGGGGGSTDSTPPTVAITAPSVGALVTGSVAVSANASDNVGVAGVQFKLDGTNLGTEVTQAPYAITWTRARPGGRACVDRYRARCGREHRHLRLGQRDHLCERGTTGDLQRGVLGDRLVHRDHHLDHRSDQQLTGRLRDHLVLRTTTTLNSSMVTAHSATLSGLVASTTYHYQVLSSNSAGEQSSAGDYTFTTQAGTTTTLPASTANWRLNAPAAAPPWTAPATTIPVP